MNFGRQPRTAIDNIISDDLDDCRNKHAYARELAEKLYKVHQRVIEIYNQVNEDRANAIEHEQKTTYSVGDQVWLFDPTTPVQRSKKLIRRWRGPYVILRISNGGVNVMKNDTETTVNIDRIRPYEHGVMSIEDQHERDIELAAQELEAVHNSIRDLTVRKKQLLNEQQIAAAGRDVERQADDRDERKYPESRDIVVDQLHVTSSTNTDYLYDFDDEESCDAVCLTSIDFVFLW